MTRFRWIRKDANGKLCILLLLSVIVLLSNCKKEKDHARSYPRLKSLPVTDITEEGVKFSGDLYSLGNETLTEYGFVWGFTDYLDYKSTDKVILGTPKTTGTFSAVVNTALKKDTEYFVKPYVATDSHVVYGPPVLFMSLGSSGPRITGFEPHTAHWGDTLKIYGNNFSWISYNNIVSLNQTKCIPISSTDTTLFVQVSPDLTDSKSVLTVSLAGIITTHTKDTFSLIPPSFNDYYPKQARWGDTIYLTGSGLKYLFFKPTNYLKIGTVNCSTYFLLSDTIISFRVPDEINTVTGDVTVNLNGIIMKANQSFQLLPPSFSITTAQGTWGNVVTLSGRFNSLYSRNTILFNAIPATILSSNTKTLTAQVPNSLSSEKSIITYKAVPFTITSADTFRLAAPVIKSFSPVSGLAGTTVTIKGKYFGTNYKPVVRFGTTSAVLTSYNDSVIVAKVPSTVPGPLKISVATWKQTISVDDFTILNPVAREGLKDYGYLFSAAGMRLYRPGITHKTSLNDYLLKQI
jgi:hypothetical protein